MFKSIIIGCGEVGKSLHEVIGGDITDITIKPDSYDILHICFSYSEGFVEEVKRYQELFNVKHTCIHSTVPIGTSRKCGAVFSPTVGVHPYLAESFKTFTKFLGGEKAGEVADYFRRHGMKVYIVDKPETLELAKISQTTQYALNIEYVKNLKQECDKYEVPFSEVYTLFSDNYNKGYAKLGMPEYTLPLLVPMMKKQGGHCTMQNCDLLTNDFTRFIIKMNKKGFK